MGPIPLTPYDLGLAAVLVLLLSATSYYARLAISQPLLLGGLRTAIDRAKVLAGLDADAEIKLIGLPGSGLVEMLRPKPSSQPAASLADVLGGLLGQSVAGLLGQLERSLAGVNALWVGDHRF